jgi:hypothetical protein
MLAPFDFASRGRGIERDSQMPTRQDGDNPAGSKAKVERLRNCVGWTELRSRSKQTVAPIILVG